MPTLNGTPKELGYVMPAEWELHTCCWMAWPYRSDLWDDITQIELEYANIALTIARFEPVNLVVRADDLKRARGYCGDKISYCMLPIDDSWTRDSGPTFLKQANGSLAATSWRFNAWGNKHQPWFDDAKLASRICASLEMPIYHSPLVFEGGALHVDGRGSVLVTESVVLNQNRNPGINKIEAEREIQHALGVENVIWLPGDWDDYETDGHVDGLACFIKPGVVLYETNPDPEDPHTAVLAENLKALKKAKDTNGRFFDLVPIEEAFELQGADDDYCKSYINFYIANNGIVAPSYGIAADKRMETLLRSLFPSREVVMVDIISIAAGGGGIHCITQQQPA